jgi:hypothetical protein
MLNGNLEYVMTSLPNLSFDNSSSYQHEVSRLLISYTAESDDINDLILRLHKIARKYLTQGQYNFFKSLNLNEVHEAYYANSSYAVVSVFSEYMRQFKAQLRDYRVAKYAGASVTKKHYEIIGELPENPLDAEVMLLRLQWTTLEELSVGHYTDVSSLFLYKLKLQLLVRWWSFDTSKGFDVFLKTAKMNDYGG